MERSLFFSHRSGSGGGVTPGTTPGGTRDIRTFFGLSTEAVDGCCAEGVGAVGIEGAAAGGGAVSIVFVIEADKASIARR